MHDKICSFKKDYLAACEAIKKSSYETENNCIMYIKDSPISISIRCPYILTQSQIKRDGAS